jgi:hypothetical protein
MLGGLIIMLGPIAAFLLASALPGLFSPSTELFWHYASAFAWILYMPLGLVIMVAGWALRYRSLKAQDQLRD